MFIWAILSFLAQIVNFLMDYMAKDAYAKGEEIRRMAMLKYGLGVEPSQDELLRIEQSTNHLKNAEPGYLEPYYSSDESEGSRRLIDVTGESAFFTASASKFAAATFGIIVLVGITLVVIGISILMRSPAPASMLVIASRVLLLSMATFGVGELAKAAIDFLLLHVSTDRITTRCCVALTKTKKQVESEAVSIFADYNTATIVCPPVPSFAYKAVFKSCNGAWRKLKTNCQKTK